MSNKIFSDDPWADEPECLRHAPELLQWVGVALAVVSAVWFAFDRGWLPL